MQSSSEKQLGKIVMNREREREKYANITQERETEELIEHASRR